MDMMVNTSITLDMLQKITMVIEDITWTSHTGQAITIIKQLQCQLLCQLQPQSISNTQNSRIQNGQKWKQTFKVWTLKRIWIQLSACKNRDMNTPKLSLRWCMRLTQNGNKLNTNLRLVIARLSSLDILILLSYKNTLPTDLSKTLVLIRIGTLNTSRLN